MTNKPRYDPQKHHRRSIRLKGYDYSQAGAYFITICAHNRECLFGEIVTVGAGSEPAPTTAPTPPTAHMRLNEYGKIVEYTWNDLVNHVAGIELREFVVMPNHIHGIIIIVDNVVGAGSVGAGSEPAPTKTHALPEIVRQLKTFSARRINEKRGTPGVPVWQRNYWEHIIRNEKSHNDIAAYIVNNPAKWEMDKLYAGGNP